MRRFLALIHGLTADQKRALAKVGLSRRMISSWRTGARFPTVDQIMLLATTCEVDSLPLYEELALARAERKAREEFPSSCNCSSPGLHAPEKGFALPAEDTAGNPPNAAFQEGDVLEAARSGACTAAP